MKRATRVTVSSGTTSTGGGSTLRARQSAMLIRWNVSTRAANMPGHLP